MIAKFHYKIMLSSIILMIAIAGYADSGSSSDGGSPSTGSGVLYSPSQYPGIKRSPGKNTIDIVYYWGELSLFSNFYEGEFSLCFVDIDKDVSYEVPSIEVGSSCIFELPCGEYEVTAESNEGLSLYGFLTIE